MSIAEKLTTIAENEQKVYDKGKESEQKAFWQRYQYWGGRNLYQYAFYDYVWDDVIYNPIYNIRSSNGNYIFQSSYITDTKVTVDLSGCVGVAYNTFNNCANLKRIRKLIVNEELSFSAGFSGCKNLTDIEIEGTIGKSISFSQSPLNVASMKSIITHLKDFSLGSTSAHVITFKDECKALLEAEGATSPNGNLWTEYVSDLGWTLA